MDPIKAVPTPLHHFMMSDVDRARALEVQAIRRLHAEDDAARKSGGLTRVIAITSYTVFDGTDPRGRMVQAGPPTGPPRRIIGDVRRRRSYAKEIARASRRCRCCVTVVQH